MAAVRRSARKKGKAKPRLRFCEFKVCQRGTNKVGTAVRMPADGAEALEWYQELCPDQPAEVLALLVGKHR